MYPFAYQKAGSVAEAVRLLGEIPDARPLAGGMSLVPAMKHRLARPAGLVDLNGLGDLRGIHVAEGEVRIGAMTIHETVAVSAEVKAAIPALAVLAGGIGDPQVRHRGTIGGSIANNDPGACYPSAVLGLGATIITDRREISADDFFVDLFETALSHGEIITAVRFPIPRRAAYVKFANAASRFSIAGVFVSERQEQVRVAVTGAGSKVFRVTEIEAALAREFAPAAIEGIAISPDNLISDVHGSAAYRAHLIPILAQRAVELCNRPGAQV